MNLFQDQSRQGREKYKTKETKRKRYTFAGPEQKRERERLHKHTTTNIRKTFLHNRELCGACLTPSYNGVYKLKKKTLIK